MTQIIVFMALVLFGTAVPGTLGVSPQALYEAGLGREAPPPCRPLTAGERLGRGIDPKGKAATYSVNGMEVCEHKIFDYGERSAYVDFVLREAPARAAISARAAAQLGDDPQVKARLLAAANWSVHVQADDPGLAAHLSRIFQEALMQTLGPQRVQRAPGSGDLIMDVALRQVDAPDLLFKVTARLGQQADQTASNGQSGFEDRAAAAKVWRL